METFSALLVLHQSFASLAFVRGIHQWPVNSPHKGPVTRKMFPFDDVIMYRNCLPSEDEQCREPQPGVLVILWIITLVLSHWSLRGPDESAIFNLILLISFFRSPDGIGVAWMPWNFADDKSTLVQVMAWCRQAPSHYLSQYWSGSMSPYGVIGLQWFIPSTGMFLWEIIFTFPVPFLCIPVQNLTLIIPAPADVSAPSPSAGTVLTTKLDLLSSSLLHL